MGNIRRVVLVALAVIFAAALGRAGHAAEMRFALVVGNDEYKSAKLATPANDAGLVANALQAAGFTVTGARNLDQSTLRETFREFVDQLAAAGPDAVAFVYLAGFGLQFEGENYFVPVDADPQRDVDIPLQTVRISDLMQPLAALPGHVKILVLDAARQNEFARGGQPLAGGLALVEPARGTAVAFNAAPGTVAPDEQGPYGAYATSLAEMIAAGGLGLDDVFARIRLRVSELTNGGEIPWYASQIEGPFFFTDRVADAPPAPQAVPLADLRSKPMRGYSSVEDAYEAALAMDTMEAYEQFLAVYPDSPFARRISAMLAVRREEIIWRRSVMADTPQAYWSYLHRYPRGPHVWDARRRLARLGGAMEPPPSFAYVDFGVPPPPPLELELIAAPVLILWGTHFAPPPPPPVVFLPPRPREFTALPPPAAARQRFALAAPAAPVVPAFVRPPRTVAPAAAPPGAAPTGAAPPGGRPATTVALPAAVQKRENSGAPGTNPAAPGAAPSSAAVTPAPVPPPPSSTAPATVKPGRRPPTPPATSPAPATVKPGTPPPPPPATEPAPATVKPGTPPPPATAPAPATVKPGTPPPPATSPAPAAVKPGKPPTPPSATEPAPATVKPATPPSPPTSPAPATVKPAAPPPPPPAAAAPKPTTVKPAAPPPPPPAAAPKPTTVKPPPPPPPAAAPKPAAAKPAPPPPPPPASAPAPAAAKPACPPGKTLAQVNGHPTCK